MNPTTNGRRVTAADVLNSPVVLKRQMIETPEWGGVSEIQELTAAEATAIGKSVRQPDGTVADDAMVQWVIASTINEDGTRMFKNDPETRARLLAGPASPIVRIGTAAVKLNGFAEDAIKDAEKNSAANQTNA